MQGSFAQQMGGGAHHRLLAPSRGRAPHQEVLGGWAARVSRGGGGGLTTGFWRPPEAGPLTRRLSGTGPRARAGGGGGSPQAFGAPLRPGPSPGGYWGQGRAREQGLTTGYWHCITGWGSVWFSLWTPPPGVGSVVCGHRPAEAVLTGGTCWFMAQGAWGRVPTLAPGGSCCLGGGVRGFLSSGR